MWDYYKDKKILITGGSGFLGTVLVHRILKTQPDVGHIYVLCRTDREGLKNRWQKWLGSAHNDVWKTNKIDVVQLDISKKNTPQDFEDALGSFEIDIVVHAASSINLDRPIGKIKNVIIEASMALAEYVSRRQDVKRFVYVSTSFANSHLQFDSDSKTLAIPIEETIYPLGDAQKEWEDISNGIEPPYVKKFPWAYAYAKHLTERLLQQKLGDKLMIVRPSIIGPALQFPVRGFSVIKSTPCVTLAAAVMLLPAWRITFASGLPNPNVNATCNAIPVDVVADRLLAHLASGNNQVVHAVGKPVPFENLWASIMKQRRYPWKANVVWVKDDWNSPKVHRIGRLFKVLGTAFDFSDANTIELQEKMDKLEPNIIVSEKGAQIGTQPQLFADHEIDLINFGAWKTQVRDSMDMFARRDWVTKVIVRVLY
ncbi:hypothetical protein NUU61_006760 [Penicillium alfredii]|uniref:Fatty acyl-CoA reductase n=1 Tax=Penicillium alfredii TaxID=1506179 RepID=A0A9W9K3X7_9EURO|nr:uncharacterized protein NUU61_006760 [Penicillium alfredii]KAJ5091890.1 hypothetical protein NUU61_006760 [Penicillium alfredii]